MASRLYQITLTLQNCRESTRGVGSAIGQFDGPITGGFNDKVGCYKCWVAKACEGIQALLSVG
jgi:hypothetical protein